MKFIPVFKLIEFNHECVDPVFFERLFGFGAEWTSAFREDHHLILINVVENLLLGVIVATTRHHFDG